MIIYHAIGSNVRLRFLVIDGTGAGATAQAPTATIRRRSDGLYWDGSAWVVPVTLLAMVEESAADLPGSYYYDFDQAVAGGGAEEYLVRYTNFVAPLQGLDEEQHVFRVYSSSLVPQRKLGHVMADDGVTLRIVVWVDEGGQRVSDYDAMSLQIKDGGSNLIVDLGTDVSDTADGLFSFETPVSAVTRNVPYVLTGQAVRALVTDAYNVGFVRV